MKKIIFSGLLLATMVSCQSDDAATTNNNSIAIDFGTLGKENLYGNGVEGINESNIVVNDDTSWEILLDQMTTVNNLPWNFGPNVDFTQSTVIATFDKVQMSGGFAIDIISVTEGNGKVVVDIEKSEGGEGAATAIITQPYHIVIIPKTTLPVTFE
jgi:hypothetical protein